LKEDGVIGLSLDSAEGLALKGEGWACGDIAAAPNALVEYRDTNRVPKTCLVAGKRKQGVSIRGHKNG
jgi:hypothetical protein